MAVEAMLDVLDNDRELLLKLLKQYLPNVAVWAYGSRVRGVGRASSDLDLAVFAPAEKKRPFYDLHEALEESSLPFQVDLYRWDEIPDTFRRAIKEYHVVLQ